MPVKRSSALYNDPAIGQIFENLGSMFAPPKASDTYAYAKARAEQQAIDLKNKAAALMNDPNASVDARDRAAAIAQLYNPTQGFGARNMADARSRDNNAADNVRALQQTGLQQSGETTRTMLAPVAAGATRFVPPSIADLYKVAPTQTGVIDVKPGDQATLPDGRVIAGAPKPLTETEVKAAAFNDLKPEERRLVSMQGVKTGSYAGPGGLPITAFDTTAADTGMAPVATPVAPNPTPRNYMTADGKGQGLMTLDGAGTPIDATTRQPLAPGAQLREIQGSAAETSIGAGPQNNVDQRLIDLSVAESAADELMKLSAANPASQGVVGQIRGTAQDLFQSGTAVGNLLKVNTDQTLKDIAAGRVDKELVGQLTNFDGSIPKITLAENNLIAQMAKLQSGDSRISNDRFNQLKAAVGSGWLGNPEKTRATVEQFKQMIQSQRQVLGPLSSDPAKLVPQQSAAPAAPAPAPNAGGLPVVQSMEDAMKLPPGTAFMTPDGRRKVRP